MRARRHNRTIQPIERVRHARVNPPVTHSVPSVSKRRVSLPRPLEQLAAQAAAKRRKCLSASRAQDRDREKGGDGADEESNNQAGQKHFIEGRQFQSENLVTSGQKLVAAGHWRIPAHPPQRPELSTVARLRPFLLPAWIVGGIQIFEAQRADRRDLRDVFAGFRPMEMRGIAWQNDHACRRKSLHLVAVKPIA